MKYLNRSAIVVKCKALFLEWVTSNQKDSTQFSLNKLRLTSFTRWVKHNICTYQRVFLLLTAN